MFNQAAAPPMFIDDDNDNEYDDDGSDGSDGSLDEMDGGRVDGFVDNLGGAVQVNPIKPNRLELSA
jgi:hypothetical protein